MGRGGEKVKEERGEKEGRERERKARERRERGGITGAYSIQCKRVLTCPRPLCLAQTLNSITASVIPEHSCRAAYTSDRCLSIPPISLRTRLRPVAMEQRHIHLYQYNLLEVY